jgi:glyoxylase-like metal-dependent hydrolase (beta-lactamase superfamily II)
MMGLALVAEFWVRCYPERMGRCFVLALGFGSFACADVTGIENRRSYGAATAMIDLFTSCFVLKTEVGPVLVDACWRPAELRVRLSENDVRPEDVQTVLLTHAHQDHVSGLSALPNARVKALAGEQSLLERYAQRPLDEALVDGQVLEFGTTRVHVYAVPGHTQGSAAYWVEGALLLGDAALVTKNGRVGQVPQDRSEDPPMAVGSLVALWDRLRAESRDVAFAIPAHSAGSTGEELGRFVEANR